MCQIEMRTENLYRKARTLNGEHFMCSYGRASLFQMYHWFLQLS